MAKMLKEEKKKRRGVYIALFSLIYLLLDPWQIYRIIVLFH
jgi:hypothetical protein